MSKPDTTIANCPGCGMPLRLGERDTTCPQCGAVYRTRPGAPQSPPIRVHGSRGLPSRNRSSRQMVGLVCLVLVVLGLMCGVGGGLIGLIGPQLAQESSARAERLSPISAVALADGKPGSEALVEGRVSERNRLLAQNMVAYTLDVYGGTDEESSDIWVERDRQTPPLRVDLPDGLVELAKGSYALSGRLHTSRVGDERYSGLMAGDQVMVLGTLAKGLEGTELRADLVYAGTRSGYIEDQRQDALVSRIIGGSLALAGLVMLVAGGLVWSFRGKTK